MQKPFFSIIIPALNEEKYLPHLLKDLSLQSFRDFEVIVVDGKSDDKTVAKAKQFTPALPALTIIVSSKRHVSVQRNLGTKHARANWLIFMDADNRLPYYYLDGIHYRILEKNPDLFTTWCATKDRKNYSKTIAHAANLLIEAAKAIEYQGAIGALIGCRRDIFTTIGGFDVNMGFGEDGEFIRRGVKKGYHFCIFKDPHFFYSLRRFRREGTLPAAQHSAKLFIKNILGEKIDQSTEYPMGGNAKPVTKSSLFVNQINKSLKQITTNSKSIQKLKLSLKEILSD